MADTNLLVLAREYKKLREEVKKVLSMPKGDKGDPGEKGEKGDKGDTGPQGFPGRDGKDGVNGFNGKDGRDGIDGKDGKDGLDGVGVSNAYIDFDNSLVIVLSDGREVNAGFLSQETKENVVATFKQGAATINELLPPQEGNANKFLKTDGTNVSWDTLDGSDIDLASPPVIGNTTPNAATFTTLTATGQTSLGGAAGSEAFRAVTTASSVNWLQATGAPANREPILSAQGSDTNISMAFQSKGTGGISLSTGSTGTNLVNGTSVTAITRTAAGSGYTTAPDVIISPPTTAGGVQATATVAISGGAITTFTITNAGSGYVEQPTVTFSGGGGSGAAAYATVGSGTTVQSLGSALSFRTPGGEQFRVEDTFGGGTAANYLRARGRNAGASPFLYVDGSDTNVGLVLGSKGTGSVSFSTNSGAQEQLRVTHTASAVNYVQVTGAATGNRPTISAQGSDTNVDLLFTGKGTGGVNTAFFHRIGSSFANFAQISGATAGSFPTFSVQGSDTNIDLALTPKGTGNVRFGTHTTLGSEVITGYITIKDSGGTLRKLAVIS